MINKFRGKYNFLSNMSACRIEYKGRTFHTTENAFMSEKNDSDAWKDFCADVTTTAKLAKSQGRVVNLVDNWDQIKDQVMYEVNRLKFNENPLKAQLLATGDQEIIEGNSWGDKYWGKDNKTWEGENKLGKILMRIREELNNS